MRSFWKSESGNFAMMTAVLLPALLGATGIAIDTANIVSAKTRLQNVVDAAVLAASRENASDSERTALFESFVFSQIDAARFTSAVPVLEFHEGLNYVEVHGTVTADVQLYLMNHLGKDRVSASATSFRSTKTLEIAMVLDNTGSMGQGGIDALKKAAHALVNAVENDGDPRQDVTVGLVPFVTAVNIKGEGYDEAWIDMKGEAVYNGWNFISDTKRTARPTRTATQRRADLSDDDVEDIVERWTHFDDDCDENDNMETLCESVKKYPHHIELFKQSKTTWKGCVEARPVPYNFDLTAPNRANPDTLFVPYFAPSEPRSKLTEGGNEDKKFNNAWLDHMTDFDLGNTTDQHKIQRSTVKYVIEGISESKRPRKTVKDTHNLTIGPNRACPTPVVPLTDDMEKVRDGIDAMQFWNGSGTNISEGLAWGWRVLSPEAPYTQGAAFGSDAVSKFMVLMTDGANVSFGASETINKSDYGSYGFLGTKGINNSASRVNGKTTQSAAASQYNTWTQTMCTQMKSQGVEVFTVIYNTTDNGVKTLFQTCATRPENFHMASNTAALEKAFADIGRSVAQLHLTH